MNNNRQFVEDLKRDLEDLLHQANLTAREENKIRNAIDECANLLSLSNAELDNQINNVISVGDALNDVRDILDNISGTTQSITTEVNEIDKAFNKVHNSIDATHNSQVSLQASFQKTTEEILSWQNAFDMFTSAVSFALEKWKEVDEMAATFGRTIGMDGADIDDYRDALFDVYADLTAQYGMTNKELFAIQEGYTKATGKARMLSKESMDGLAAASKLIGKENMDSIADAMDNLGGGAQNAAAAAGNIYARAKAQGLDAQKAAKGMADALKMSQKYTFKEGVNGMSKMVAQAQALKVSLQTTEKMMDKFSNVEDAITTSAKLQVLGGDIGAAFANPMEMMGLAMTDAEQFQEKTLSAFKNLAYFDEKKGRMEMAPVNKARLNAAADALGISHEDAWNAAIQEGKQAEIQKAISSSGLDGKLNEDNQAWLKNNADYDAKKGWSVTYVDENGDMQTEAISGMTDEMIAYIQKRNTPEEAMADDVSAIRSMLARTKGFAEDTRSLNEKKTGAKESAGDTMADGIDAVMSPLNMILNKYLVGWKSALALVGVGAAGTLGLRIAAQTARRYARGKGSIFGKKGATPRPTNSPSGGGGAPTPPNGGTSGGATPNGRGAQPRVRDNAMSAAQKARARGGGSRRALGSAYKAERYHQGNGRIKSGVNAAKATVKTSRLGKMKMPKLKGKAGIAAGAVMIGATLYGASKLSSDSTPQAESINDTEGDDMILELQKQTSLLETIANALGADTSYLNSMTSTFSEDGDDIEPMPKYYGVDNQIFEQVGGIVKGAASYGVEQKILQKGATKLIGQAAKGGGAASGVGLVGSMAASGLNMWGQSTGKWEEGSWQDHGLNIAAQTASYAGLGATLGGPVGAAIGASVGAIKGVADEFSESINAEADELLATDNIGKNVLGLGAKITGTQLNLVKNTLGTFENTIGDTIGSVVDGVTDAYNEGKDGLYEIANGNFIEGVEDLAGAAGSLIQGVFNAPVDGAKALINGIGDTVGGFVDDVSDLARGGITTLLGNGEETEERRQEKISQAEQHVFEREKLGVTDIADPDLARKSQLATIGIHDLLISWRNEENGLGEEGESAEEVQERLDDAAETHWYDGLATAFGFSKGGEVPEPNYNLPVNDGDTVLARLAPGEVVLNEDQQDTLRNVYESLGMKDIGEFEKIEPNTKQSSFFDKAKDTLSSAAMGAAVGSIVPGIGTALGGAIGGLVGMFKSNEGESVEEEKQMSQIDKYRMKAASEAMGFETTPSDKFIYKVLEPFANEMVFNDDTKQFEMSQIDKMRLNSVAETIGMSYDDAWKYVTQNDNTSEKNEYPSRIGEDNRDLFDIVNDLLSPIDSSKMGVTTSDIVGTIGTSRDLDFGNLIDSGVLAQEPITPQVTPITTVGNPVEIREPRNWNQIQQPMSLTPQDINLNINGTLHIEGKNGSGDIDIKQLCNNTEFRSLMYDYITGAMNSRGQLGSSQKLGASSAQRGYGYDASNFFI